MFASIDTQAKKPVITEESVSCDGGRFGADRGIELVFSSLIAGTLAGCIWFCEWPPGNHASEEVAPGARSPCLQVS